MTEVLLVGGSPAHVSEDLMHELIENAEYVCAVDSGADQLFDIGHAPNLFCGDADSLSQKGITTIGILAAQEYIDAEVYEEDKDATDLELALQAIKKRVPDARITACNMLGGRTDHELAVIGCLANCGMPVMIQEEDCLANIMLEDEEWGLLDMEGMGFSFIPLEHNSVVTLEGMKWDLDHKVCHTLSDLGISNIIEKDQTMVTCNGGSIIAFTYENPKEK